MDGVAWGAVAALAFGISLIVFRGWWVRERIGYYKGLTESWSGTRTDEKAERKLKWYETHQIKAERQAIYVGCGFLLLGIMTLLVRWGMSGH